MVAELKPIKYIDYKIYNVTKIKNKYGFRVVLILEDNSEITTQHSGFEKSNIAEKEKCKVIAKLEMGTYTVYTNFTVKRYMEYWFEYIVPKRLSSEGSIDTYKNSIFNHIIPELGNLKLTNLKRGHIKKFYEKLFTF